MQPRKPEIIRTLFDRDLFIGPLGQGLRLGGGGVKKERSELHGTKEKV